MKAAWLPELSAAGPFAAVGGAAAGWEAALSGWGAAGSGWGIPIFPLSEERLMLAEVGWDDAAGGLLRGSLLTSVAPPCCAAVPAADGACTPSWVKWVEGGCPGSACCSDMGWPDLKGWAESG